MKKNKRIIVFFTLVFLVAVIINIVPIKGAEAKKVSVFSDIRRPQVNLDVQDSLNKNGITMSYTGSYKDVSDIKLKYSSAITNAEKDMYDVYNLKQESLYSVNKKGYGEKLNYEDIQKFLSSGYDYFNQKILLFTPNTSQWFDEFSSNRKAYIYDSVGNIINDDKTITGILFESEVDNMDNYDVNPVYKDNNKITDNLCILIKRNIFKKDTEEKIFNDLKKKIDELKGENDGE